MYEDLELVKKIIMNAGSVTWNKLELILRFSATCSIKYLFKIDLIDSFFDNFNTIKEVNHFINIFNSKINIPEEKFNRIKFEIKSEEEFTVEYYWDQDGYLTDKINGSRHTDEWFGVRTSSILNDINMPDHEYWQRGVFIYEWKHDQMHFKGTVYNNEIAREVHVVHPQFVLDEFKTFYEETNFGILSPHWKRWNRIIINVDNLRNIDNETDVEYQFDEGI